MTVSEAEYAANDNSAIPTVKAATRGAPRSMLVRRPPIGHSFTTGRELTPANGLL